jgi:phospholipid/cholesterol/gamma-HCH transport system substrate-binding protein
MTVTSAPPVVHAEPPRRSLKPLIAPLLVVLGTVAAIYLGNKLLFPEGGGYFVKAEFKDAAGLTKNSDVKIGGVPGGKVKSIKLTKRDTALVTMELDKGAFPLGAGASAASRPVNLLGEKYVDMQAGNLKKPVASGSLIPLSRTSRPVELDDVLNMLDPDVRARLRILINEAGIAMGGRGTDLNALIEQLPGALDQTGELVSRFSADSTALKQLIERSDRVLASVGPNDKGLEHLVTAARDALSVTASRRHQLADTVRSAPAALRQLRTSMRRLATTASDLEPMAVQLRGAAPQLASTLAELPQFAKDAKPALATAKAVSPDISRLGKQAQPTVARLKPTSEALDKVAADLAPIATSFDTGSMRGMLGLMNGWSRTIRRSDGLGHVFGLRITFDKELVTSLLDRYVTPVAKGGPTSKTGPRKVAPKLPQLPKLPKVPGLPPMVNGVIGGVQKAVDDVNKILGNTSGAVGGVLKGITSGGDAAGGAPGGQKRSDAGRLLDYLVGP